MLPSEATSRYYFLKKLVSYTVSTDREARMSAYKIGSVKADNFELAVRVALWLKTLLALIPWLLAAGITNQNTILS